MYRKLSDILKENEKLDEGTPGCADCEYMKDQTDGDIDTCDECAAEERANANEAIGDSAKCFYDLQDEYCGDECPSTPHRSLIDELVRYLSGDQLQDFCDDFRRHHMAEAAVDEADVEEDNAFNSAAAAAKNAGESHFTFNGKKYKVKMDADTASSLSESVQRYKTLAGI